MSKITKKDPATEESYSIDRFNPATETVKYSYTSARVAVPCYNRYHTDGRPPVIGYYTDWSQYDGRITGDQIPNNRGRGVDLMLVDPCAYDKLILGFVGILGDQGEKAAAINNAAPHFGRSQPGEVTFLDFWGDCQSYNNCGFSSWKDIPMPAHFYQDKVQGVLGGLRDLQKRAKDLGHNLALSFSIGGWTMSNGFHALAKDQRLRQNFCASVVDIFKRFPMFTEVDFDWEYPGAAVNNNPYGEEDGDNYALLIGEALDALKNAGLGHVKISIACSAVPDILAKSKIPALIEKGLYGINVMTYDFFGTPWATRLSHHTNLYATSENEHEGSYNSIERAVDYLLSIGIPSERINIGYAGYTRNAKGANLTGQSPLTGSYNPNYNSTTNLTTGTLESGTSEWSDVIYNYLDLEKQEGKNGFEFFTDEKADADYLYNAETKFFMSLDTPRSVKAKAEYVIKNKLGGIMTWTADQDNGLLVNAAREGLGCRIKNQNIDMSPFYFAGKNANNIVIEKGPIAIITGPDKAVAAGDEVQINGNKSIDFNEKPLTYEWTIPQDLKVNGDVNAKNISVIVPKNKPNKSYPIKLTVSNGSRSHSDTFLLKVKNGANLPPKAKITGSTTVTVGVAASLSGESSEPSSVDGKISQYFWQIPESVSASSLTTSVLNFTVERGNERDVIEIKLTVTDEANETTDTVSYKVTISAPSDIPAWDKTKAYDSFGHKVSHNGKVWANKWWVQGTEPGFPERPDAYPWEEIGS